MGQSNMHQYWAENSLMLPRDVTNTDVSLGDPLALAADGSKVVTGSEETWDTDAATTRRNFARKYAGDSAQDADAGEFLWANGDANKSKVRVDTAGCRRIDSPAAGAYVVGTLLGLKKASGNNLEDDVFQIVTDEREATHRVVYTPVGTNPTFVVAQILSRVFSQAPPSDAVILAFPVNLATVANGDVVTNFTPGFAGDVVGFDYVANLPASTAARAATFNLEIGTTDMTGGVLALTTALATPQGKVTSATAITAANSFGPTDTISIEASSVTAFAEGNGTLFVKCRRRGG